MLLKISFTNGALLGLMGSGAYAAACGLDGQSIGIVASDFPTTHAVADPGPTLRPASLQ